MEKSSILTSDELLKLRVLLESEQIDNVALACNLLTSLNASETDWLELFPGTKMRRLLCTWDAMIWKAMVDGMKSYDRLYQRLINQLREHLNTNTEVSLPCSIVALKLGPLVTMDDLEELGSLLSRLIRDADNSVLGLLLSAIPNEISASYPSNAWYALRNWDTIMNYIHSSERKIIEKGIIKN